MADTLVRKFDASVLARPLSSARTLGAACSSEATPTVDHLVDMSTILMHQMDVPPIRYMLSAILIVAEGTSPSTAHVTGEVQNIAKGAMFNLTHQFVEGMSGGETLDALDRARVYCDHMEEAYIECATVSFGRPDRTFGGPLGSCTDVDEGVKGCMGVVAAAAVHMLSVSGKGEKAHDAWFFPHPSAPASSSDEGSTSISDAGSHYSEGEDHTIAIAAVAHATAARFMVMAARCLYLSAHVDLQCSPLTPVEHSLRVAPSIDSALGWWANLSTRASHVVHAYGKHLGSLADTDGAHPNDSIMPGICAGTPPGKCRALAAKMGMTTRECLPAIVILRVMALVVFQ